MKDYLIQFDFTTVHRGGKFIGRSGQIPIHTDAPEKEIDINRIEMLCREFIHIKKPKWNVLMINIKSIQALSPKP